MNLLRRFGLIFLTASLLVLSGCSPSEEEKKKLEAQGKILVGKWEEKEHTWIFYDDGQFEHENTIRESQILREYFSTKGSWEVVKSDGKVLTVHLESRSKSGATSTWTIYVDVQDDVLRLKYLGDDGTWRLRRARQ
ncbi:MAG: hypothetical protein ACE5JS_02560 [Nitrospinota bacterium]